MRAAHGFRYDPRIYLLHPPGTLWPRRGIGENSNQAASSACKAPQYKYSIYFNVEGLGASDTYLQYTHMVIIIETKAIVSKNPETSCLKPGGSGPGEFAGLERSGNACNYSA